jgi:hypothetical protein
MIYVPSFPCNTPLASRLECADLHVEHAWLGCLGDVLALCDLGVSVELLVQLVS